MATPPSDDPLADPRVLAARRRLQSAQVDLAAKEKMMAERTAGAGNVLSAAWLRHNVGHWMLLSLGFALASGAALWCYYLLNTVFVAGRAVAMGTGMFCGFVASYTSQYFLASLQATFDGNVELDELSVLNWKEWFWTLPSTLGMFAWGLILGYIVSLAMPGYRLPIMCGVLFLSYPYLQLSTLETESPLLPFSLEVARTFRYAPIAWLVFYVSWGVGLSVVFAVMLALARSSVWLAAAVFGPTAATIVVGYAVSLGRLARHLDDAISAEEDEDDEDD